MKLSKTINVENFAYSKNYVIVESLKLFVEGEVKRLYTFMT